MANPQDSKSRRTPSGPEPGATPTRQPNTASKASPSAGHDQMNPGYAPTQRTDAASTGVSSSSAGNVRPISTSAGDDQPMSEKISDTATGILDKAKETASGTYDAVATQANNKIEERKGELSTGLRTLADSFRKTGTDLRSADQKTTLTDMTAQYTGTAANQIDKVASYFERKNLRAMMRDAEGFARRNPAIFLGAAFALGMVAARFLKSSAPDSRTSTNAGSINTSLPSALPPPERPGNPPTRPA